jgi:NDP-sugar pyrophosphorylase family protein
MVLGYSGFVPKLSRLIKLTVMNQRLNDNILHNLAAAGVHYVIIDNLAIDARKDKDFLRSSKFVRIIYDRKDEVVAELNQVPTEKDIKKLIQMWKKKEDYLE